MPTDAGTLLALYDEQMRGRAGAKPPLGTVVEQHGPALVTHHGTHCTVDHAVLTSAALESITATVAEVCRSAAARVEPTEWRVHANDPAAAELAGELVRAGFTPGWQRSVLVAEIDDIAAPGLPGASWKVGPLKYWDRQAEAEVVSLAQRSGPHRVTLGRWLEVGRARTWDIEIAVLTDNARAVAASWAENVADTQFMAIGGMSAPRAELLCAWVDWMRSWYWQRRKRYLTADADGALRAALTAAGFREVTAVQSFHFFPPGTPSAIPPVNRMIADPEDHEVWDRVAARLGFSATRTDIRISAPVDLFSWHTDTLDGPEDPRAMAVEHVIRRGLLACMQPGEHLYLQPYQHQGYRFDARRVGGDGQPRWPGMACAWDEHQFLATADGRLGTYADPYEQILCVFGTELLNEVSDELGKLLGNEGVWSFG